MTTQNVASSDYRLIRFLALPILLTLAVGYGVVGNATSEPQEQAEEHELSAGERIYRYGILPSGKAVTGFSQGDVPLSGAELACENCHRRSGLGSSEGSSVVPPITWPGLFSKRENQQRLAFQSRSLSSQERPAYTTELLARAIRSGQDSAGNELDLLMPRYEMSDLEIGDLSEYLKGLSRTLPPGVTDTHMHFATIISPDVDPSARAKMLEVFEAFVRDKNAETRNESRRSARGVYFRDFAQQSYRKWVLHTWELKGERDDWPRQLAELYASNPVFAVLSGIVEGNWQPVHEFCEAQKLPCLFPITDQPVPGGTDFYTIYVHEGLPRHAKALREYLTELPPDESSRPILQVFRPDSTGATMARWVREYAGISKENLREIVLEENGSPADVLWSDLMKEHSPSVILAWLPVSDIRQLNSSRIDGLVQPKIIASDLVSGPDVFHLSGSLLDSQLSVLSLFDMSKKRDQGLLRLRAWLKSRGFSLTNERVQADSYLASLLVGSAVKHMRGNFSREYLIERIEHGLDNTVFRSVYPRLSLGPNQRFASKECLLLRPSEEDPQLWIPEDATRIR